MFPGDHNPQPAQADPTQFHPSSAAAVYGKEGGEDKERADYGMKNGKK